MSSVTAPPLAEYTATRPYPCGHPRTSENTVSRPDRADACRTCQRVANAEAWKRRSPKNVKRPQWITAMTPVQEREARALYNRWLAEQSGTSRDSTDTAQGALAI